MPRRVVAASWGGLIVGGACILVALMLVGMTMAAASRLQNNRS